MSSRLWRYGVFQDCRVHSETMHKSLVFSGAGGHSNRWTRSPLRPRSYELSWLKWWRAINARMQYNSRGSTISSANLQSCIAQLAVVLLQVRPMPPISADRDNARYLAIGFYFAKKARKDSFIRNRNRNGYMHGGSRNPSRVPVRVLLGSTRRRYCNWSFWRR